MDRPEGSGSGSAPFLGAQGLVQALVQGLVREAEGGAGAGAPGAEGAQRKGQALVQALVQGALAQGTAQGAMQGAHGPVKARGKAQERAPGHEQSQSQREAQGAFLTLRPLQSEAEADAKGAAPTLPPPTPRASLLRHQPETTVSKRGPALSPQLLSVGPLSGGPPLSVGTLGLGSSMSAGLLPAVGPRPSGMAQRSEVGASSSSPGGGTPQAGQAGMLPPLPLSLSWPIPAGAGQGQPSELEHGSFLDQLRALRDRLLNREPEARRDSAVVPPAGAAPLAFTVYPARAAPAVPTEARTSTPGGTAPDPRLGLSEVTPMRSPGGPSLRVSEPVSAQGLAIPRSSIGELRPPQAHGEPRVGTSGAPSAPVPGELRLFGVRLTSGAHPVESTARKDAACPAENAPHIPALAAALSPGPGSRVQGGGIETHGASGPQLANDWPLGAGSGLGAREQEQGIVEPAVQTVGTTAQKRKRGEGEATPGAYHSSRLPSSSPTLGSPSKTLFELLAMALKSGAASGEQALPAALAQADRAQENAAQNAAQNASQNAARRSPVFQPESQTQSARLTANLSLQLSPQGGPVWPVNAIVGKADNSALPVRTSAKGTEPSLVWDLNQIPKDPARDSRGPLKHQPGGTADGRGSGGAGASAGAGARVDARNVADAGSKRSASETGAGWLEKSPRKKSGVHGKDLAVPPGGDKPWYTGEAHKASLVAARRDASVSPQGARTWLPDLNDQNEGGAMRVSAEQRGAPGSAEAQTEGHNAPLEQARQLPNPTSPLTATSLSDEDPKAPGSSAAKPQRKRKRRLVPRSAWAKDLMNAAAEKNGTPGGHPSPKT